MARRCQLKVLDYYGGVYREQSRLSRAVLESPMNWTKMVFRLARNRFYPDLRGGRQ